MTKASDIQLEPIAIVGIGCRFPGGIGTPGALWRFLCCGGDAIGDVPAGRWSAQALPADAPYALRGGFLDAFDEFDPAFFGIDPKAAGEIDPQHRLLLEVTWEALEDAGMPVSRLAGGHVGVFTGITAHDYEQLRLQTTERSLLTSASVMGMSPAHAASRVSRWFDFRGPSMVVDTAFSSSLTAVHLACRSLQNGECTIAIASAASMMLRPEPSIALGKAGMLSPTGTCRPFDAKADGYVRAEGGCAIVLKPLSAAHRDGDPIYAFILGSAANQDGSSERFTVPNAAAQEAVMRAALADAEITPHTVQYIEAHGTGIPAADAVEATVLGTVFGAGRPGDSPCLIGSIKGNIGHTECVAGLAGLAKTALMLRQGRMVPTVNFNAAHPVVPLDTMGLRVPEKIEAWAQQEAMPRIACVNAFGLGGSNTHVVLAAPPQNEDGTEKPITTDPRIIVLSAKNDTALRETATRWSQWFDTAIEPPELLDDLALTSTLRREHMPHRLAMVATSFSECRSHLDAFTKGSSSSVWTGVAPGAKPRIAFVFSGMGQQWSGMARDLLTTYPVVAETIDACDAAFSHHMDTWPWSVRRLIEEGDTDMLHRARYGQRCVFAVQVALAALLESWGIGPCAVLGHSIGEIAAAYVAGALSLDDAAAICCHRSRLLETYAGQGAMLVTGLSSAEAAERIQPHGGAVSVAEFNSSRHTVLSGDKTVLEELATMLAADGVPAQMLPVDVPYHGPQLANMVPELLNALGMLEPQAGNVPIVSTVTSTVVDGATMDAIHWCRNVCDPVHFSPAVNTLMRLDVDVILEVAAHPVLAPALNEITRGRTLKVLPVMQRGTTTTEDLLAVAACLYCRGQALRWEHIVGAMGKCVHAPVYPWQHQQCWIESDASRRIRLSGAMPAPAAAPAIAPTPSTVATPTVAEPSAVTASAPPVAEPAPVPAAVAAPALPLPTKPSLPYAMPTPRAVAKALAPGLTTLLTDLNRQEFYADIVPRLDLLCATYVVEALRVMGWDGTSARSSAALAEELSVAEPRKPLLDRLLARAAEQGLLTQRDSAFAVAVKRKVEPARTQWQALLRDAPNCMGELALIDRSARNLPDILHGKDLPPDLTDADASGEAHLRESSPTFCVYNKIVREILRCAKASLPPDARFHVLEAGGGTGSLTAHVLPLLGSAVDAYVFTDANATSVAHAADAYAQSPCFLSKMLDLDRDIVLQGFAPQSFDIVLASDAVLVAANVQTTLKRLSSLVAPGGLLIITKLAAPPAWFDLVFGTRATWLACTDTTTKAGQSALNGPAWQKLLTACEFSEAVTTDDRTDRAAALLNVILAQVPPGNRSAAPPPAAPKEQPTPKAAPLPTGPRATPLPPLPPGMRGAHTRTTEVLPPSFAIDIRGPQVHFIEAPRKPPASGEVELMVHAVGLNLRDTMRADSTASGTPASSWPHNAHEAAGTVLRMGTGIRHLKVNDRVTGFVQGAFARITTTPASLLTPIPPTLSFDEAATLPLSYMAAQHAIESVAKVRKGERVLIQSAAGGTGMALIIVALARGAVVYATASSPAKRDLLLAMGATWAGDSRSPSCAADVYTAAEGIHMDVVVNMLPADTVAASASLLHPRTGRFIDMVNLFTDAMVPARAIYGGALHTGFDILEVMDDDPSAARRQLASIVTAAAAAQRTLPPLPYRVVDATSISQALADMRHECQMGKLVVAMGALDTRTGA